ncbi:phosphopantothenoylcysteine decarboxylase [Malassezia brasiliensis]|uniref:Phosphopantothenoylcysteine decarboxylase n=1 Tax=Malassezia brasiliensis TaxID=1821822 RepID=A0AAF0IS54_9BASI|nr:phosphopantothenoylcysteine decarboxylase [Malassezia brasiliensis]
MSDVPRSLRSMYAPLQAPPTSKRPLHVVLACTGSVASVKVSLMAKELLKYANVQVQIVATRDALHFVDRDAIRHLNDEKYTVKDLSVMNKAAEMIAQGGEATMPQGPRLRLWTDADEWGAWKELGDPVLHIEVRGVALTQLRRWADIVLLAPCSANTLAKIAHGLCDNIVTSFLRALSPDTPTWVFPAMNTLMYLHPLTEQHLDVLRKTLHYEVFGPIEKRLACGDLGT